MLPRLRARRGINHDALRANLHDRRPPPRRRSAGPIRGSTPRLQPDLGPEEAIRTTRCGRTDSEMERMWPKRNGREPNSLGTSRMTHAWVLPPAFALWYSHRSESRSDSRDCYGRPTAPKCKPESNATCGKHAWTIPDAARARRTANAGLGQRRPQSTDFTHHFLVVTPLAAHQTLHAAFLCPRAQACNGVCTDSGWKGRCGPSERLWFGGFGSYSTDMQERP